MNLPQVAETRTPLLMDLAGGVFVVLLVYDLRIFNRCSDRKMFNPSLALSILVSRVRTMYLTPVNDIR